MLAWTPLAGAMAGCLSKTCVYPLDVVKKRFQVVGFEKARLQFGRLPEVAKSGSTFPSSLFASVTASTLQQVWLKEGLNGLFKGWVPAMLKASVSTGLTFTFFEIYRSLISS